MKTKKQIKYVGECGNCHSPNWSPSHECLKPEKTQHTPTPWIVTQNYIAGPDKEMIADVCIGLTLDQKVQLANATFIVRAVNEYDEHKQLIKELAKDIQKDTETINTLRHSHEALLDAAKDAFATLQAIPTGRGSDHFISVSSNKLIKAIAQAEGK